MFLGILGKDGTQPLGGESEQLLQAREAAEAARQAKQARGHDSMNRTADQSSSQKSTRIERSDRDTYSRAR